MTKMISGITKTSVEHGGGAPVDPGARKAHPKTPMPDRVDAALQRNKNQELKAGLSSSGNCKPNPGAKPH